MNTTDPNRLWQRFRIREADPEEAHHDVAHLEHRIEKLTLICRAMFEMLAKSHGWQDDDLLAKVAEIDLRDGFLDERLSPNVFTCPKCNHKINSHHRACLYCGSTDFHHDVFDEV